MKTALVVGSGPAGLMAADVLGDHGLAVTVAEAKPSFARKFLMAGKSGLNLTMDQPMDTFAAAYGDNPIADMVRGFGPKDVITLTHDLGQETFVGTSKRVFPKAMKASPFLRALLSRLRTQGTQLHANWRWMGLPQPGQPHVFQTPDDQRLISPDVTVLALGGGSWARLGSDGAWMKDFESGGVSCVPFMPSNMGVHVDWSVKMVPFFGIPVKAIALCSAGHRQHGEMVITSRGFEGGVVYGFSSEVRAGKKLFLDLLPDQTPADVEAKLAKPKGKQSLSNHIRKTLRLSDVKRALLQEWGRPLPTTPADLTQLLKALPMPDLKPFPIDEAISTAGGVSFDAVTDDLMLKSHPSIFCAGEMLDWDAPTGGYLITACLASGRKAGMAAAQYALCTPSHHGKPD